MLRVLFVTNSWPHDARPGYGSHADREVRALRAAGVDVRVLPIHGHLSRWAYAGAALELRRITRRHRFDLVHGFLGHAAAVSRLQMRAPLVITFTGSDLLGDHARDGGVTAKSRVESAVFRRLARTASATITCAANLERLLPAACRGRNHVIPTSVPVEMFRPMPQAQARERLGWPADERVVLFAADPPRRVKNYPLAAAACERLAAEMPGVRLRATARVPWEQMPLWMNAADVLLLTSRSEASPGAVKEAMACEVPVVSVPVGDVAEVVEGVPGCYLRPPRPEALAEALALALAHGRSPQARTAVAAFDVEPTARRVISVYDQVLGRSPAAA